MKKTEEKRTKITSILLISETRKERKKENELFISSHFIDKIMTLVGSPLCGAVVLSLNVPPSRCLEGDHVPTG